MSSHTGKPSKYPPGFRGCGTCKEVKPLAEFSGGNYRCKPCRSIHEREQMRARNARRDSAALRAEREKESANNRLVHRLISWPVSVSDGANT